MRKSILIIIGIIVLFVYSKLMVDYSSTTFHLLGIDEFGRDNISVIILSSIYSMTLALLLTVLSFIFSGVIAYFILLFKNRIIHNLLRSLSNLTESIPMLIWLFIIIIGFRNFSRVFVVILTFIFAALPYLTNVIYGEFERLWNVEFVESAKIAGLKNYRIIFKFILPNALSVLIPVGINVYGAALTINGVIGLLGMGNRMDYEIGTVLMRGKEYVLINPEILILGIISLVLIFLSVFVIAEELKIKISGKTEINSGTLII